MSARAFGQWQQQRMRVGLESATVFDPIYNRHLSSKYHRFPAFIRLSAKGRKESDITENDIPDDWSEDDILADFDDLEPESSEIDSTNAENDDEDLDTISFEDEDEDEDEEDLIEEEDDEDDEFDDIDLESDDSAIDEEYVVSSAIPDVPDDDPSMVEWDEEEDGGDYELEDDPNDENYMKQKKLVQAAIESSEQRMREDSFDPLDFIMNEMTEDQAQIIEKLPFLKDIEAKTRGMLLEESDVEDVDFETAIQDVPDFIREDEYPRHAEGESNFLEDSIGVTDNDMEELDRTYKEIRDSLDEEPWDKVMLKSKQGIDHLSNETLLEMEACLEELGGSAYNVTRWLIYDLDFNVSNLMLASIKHNPEAPILFHHWYPQLVTYSRYKDIRSRDFDFTWEDVDKSDTDELKRYYLGFGYPEIPTKAPSETGIISLEDLDEEEIKMAAFESWMAEVYNPEWDKKDFDDDDMQDTDNVFSEYFELPQHPDKPSFEDVQDDLEEWNAEMADNDPETIAYRDRLGQSFNYKVVRDEEFQKEFRGHLVISCSADDADLDVAEKITLRFREEFGKKVWVETRVEALAREDDNVFEIWLESYEIDLLHSKKRATSSNQDWEGPAECDAAQIEFLVDRVRFLISDDARHSYRMEFEHTE